MTHGGSSECDRKTWPWINFPSLRCRVFIKTRSDVVTQVTRQGGPTATEFQELGYLSTQSLQSFRLSPV